MIFSWLRLVRATAQPLVRSLRGVSPLRAPRGCLAGYILGSAGLCLVISGCSLIDDFSQFRIVRGDGGDDDAGSAGSNDAAIPLCGGEDCSKLNGPCRQGECIDERCVATPIRDGRTCGDDACTVCGAGECNAPKDCSEYDGPCTRGMCNPTGGCAPANINEGQACFDNEPCTVSESCVAGKCTGAPRDCSNFDDQCSAGTCEKETGLCTFGAPTASSTCDDFNPCTTNDRCDATGRCIPAGNALAGAPCNDQNACTGTLLEPDVCDGMGECASGENVAAGSRCNDDNECSDPDTCNGTGVCTGPAVREGEACETACKTANACRRGSCQNAQGLALGYKSQCYFNWCDSESLCQDRWQGDGACDCGCGFSDRDCNACSPRMCEAKPDLSYRAAKWCDARGQAISICPDSLKGDGKCDCGCQFEDPDCSGGSCCSATQAAGCDNAFVEACVCERQGGTDADPSCCKGQWTARCAELAVQLGCMICP